MAKLGRPTKYRADMCERVVELMKEGCSKAEVCADLDIDYHVFLAYQERHPAFLQAVKRGEQLSEAWWVKQGRLGVWQAKDAPNVMNHGLWYMNMKNRFGWSDKQEVKQDGELKITINTSIPEPDEE